MVKNTRTLVLNADYTPFSVISWKRAIVRTMIYDEIPEEGAQIVEVYEDDFIQTGGGKEMPVPAVIRLCSYKRKKKEVPYNRGHVFIRDRMTCQYCHKKLKHSELTLDHVISKSEWKKLKLKGTATRWTNIVTSCEPCNSYKGSHSLEKSGLRLSKKPEKPNPEQFIPGFNPYKRFPPIWIPYLLHTFGDIFKDNINADIQVRM